MNITYVYESQLSDPEAKAMLGAFYSRSSLPINQRLSELEGKTYDDIKRVLNKYAIGYGHRSILDLANAPLLFVEGISILATKGIEAHCLGNYQETSTRYLNFTEQRWINPVIEAQGREWYILSESILECWISRYKKLLPIVETLLRNQFPKEKDQKESIYLKAIKAKTFDILRSLLPTAMKTNVAMQLNFSSLKDHLFQLSQHPLPELQVFSQRVLNELQQQFSFAFPRNEEIPTIPCIHSNFYLNTQTSSETYPYIIDKLVLDLDEVNSRFKTLSSEEMDELEKVEGVCPAFLAKLGSIRLSFQLDYGSWRDLQRHRNVLYNKCSLIRGPTSNFYWDYFQDIHENIINEYLDEFIFYQFNDIETLQKSLSLSDYETQYFYPLGTIVDAELVCTLPELAYIIQLRSSKAVHFTLRRLIHRIYQALPERFKKFITADTEPSPFYYERGFADITKKKE